MTERNKHIVQTLIACATVGILMIFIGVNWDYFLELNDDILIADITSGAYTGTPEAHNIQMLYPLGLVLSSLYRIARGLDWYGIFLAGTQFVCLTILLAVSLYYLQIEVKEKRPRRIISYALITCILVTLVIPHLVILQYTFTCAFLSATAAFLFLTTENRPGLIAGVAMLLLAFVTRSEMMLLTLPMVALALLYRGYTAWKTPQAAEAGEGQKQINRNVRATLIAAAVTAIGIVACLGIHSAAYGSAEWKEFTRLFDNRTELYDFHAIPTYEEDKAFFDENGFGAAESALLVRYNYGLTQKVDADFLGRAAAYAFSKEADRGGGSVPIPKAVSDYLYRIRHIAMPEDYTYPQTDAPFNLITILLYLAVLLLYMMPEEPEPDEDGTVALLSVSSMKAILPKLLIFLAVRSALWMFILLRGRDPVRVTHGMYLVEIAILFALFLRRIHIILGLEVSAAEYAKMPETKRRRGPDGKKLPVSYADAVKMKRWSWDSVSKVRSFRMAMAFILLMITISFLSGQILVAGSTVTAREETAQMYRELFATITTDKEHTYLMDTYTYVPYTEKAFARDGNAFKNYDLMGGWACKSPLQNKKALYAAQTLGTYPLAENGTPLPMEEALLQGDQVLFVTKPLTETEGEPDPENTQWLIDYAAERGADISLTEVTRTADSFIIYRVEAR